MPTFALWSLALHRTPTWLLLAAALLCGAAAQADQLDEIRKRGELVVGVLGTDEPSTFIDPKTREIVGYEVDLARAVASKLGVRLTLKQMSVAARIPELQQGRVDLLAASLSHTKEREAVIDFSLTTLVTGQQAMVKVSSGFTSLAQLSGKKVVTVKGGTQEPNTRKAIAAVEVVTFDNGLLAFQALSQGKGAAFVNEDVSLLRQLANLGEARSQYLILPEKISVEAVALGIRKGEAGFKALVDGSLRELEKSGEADRLFMKWYGPGSKIGFPKRGFKIETDRIGA